MMTANTSVHHIVQGENEPFLNKNYEEYLYYAHKKIIDIMTNTNGSTITKKDLKDFRSGLTRLRFSLDHSLMKLIKRLGLVL